MSFSHRTAWDLRPNPIASRLEALRRSGSPLIDLTESNPSRCGLDYPEEEILSALASPGSLSYQPDPRGLFQARAALAQHLLRQGVAIEPSRLLLTASTSEAYSYLFKLLCDPGDEVLVPNPSYPLFEFLTGLESVASRPYPLRFEDRWRLDAPSLAEAASPRTRAVLVVNPQNPTGSFLDRSDFAALAALCAERGWALLSDEVFADYGFRETPELVRSVLSQESPVLTFSLGGLSKSACLPGLKLSWLGAGGPQTRVEEALARLEVVADTYLSVGTPVQRALGKLLELGASVRQQLRDRLGQNRAALVAARPDSASWSVLPSEGGWYAVLRIPQEPGEEAVCLALLERGLLVHPGYFFDFPGGAHLVVSLILAPPRFAQGLSLLVEVLA